MCKSPSLCKLGSSIVLSALLLSLLPAPASAAPRKHLDLDYAGDRAAGKSTARTLDVFLPATGDSPPPLLVFVHGGIWSLPDTKYTGRGIASALVPKGVAVALVRYRLAPVHPYPAPVADVVAALDWLARRAVDFGYDPGRIVLAGHGAGAQIAALAALDETVRATHRLGRELPARVVLLGGLLDLESWAEQSARHRGAVLAAAGEQPIERISPLRRVRAGAAPFLVLSAAREPRYQQVGARAFVEALRQAGYADALWLSIAQQDFLTLSRLDADNPATDLVVGFVRGVYDGELSERMQARRAWQDPPLTTAGFWERPDRIREYPVDERFYRTLLTVVPDEQQQLNGWSLDRFFAIDLDVFVDTLPATDGAGDWLTLTNVHGEQIVWRRSEIMAYGPKLVVGLDGERNLFRIASFYRMRSEYSWRTGPQPPLMVRPLGAFVYFEKEPPEHLRETLGGLTPASFRLAAESPLAGIGDLSPSLASALTDRHNCLSCHSFRGTGASAHHVTALEAAAHGGFALPLESYPEPVLRRFLFDQEGLAEDFGITANVMNGADAEALYRLLSGRASP